MTRPIPFLELRQELPVIFWPILYWSLKWFVGHTAELRAAGHEHIRWHVTWDGVIKVTWVDTPDPLRALRELPGWKVLQVKLMSPHYRVPSASWDSLRLAEESTARTSAVIRPGLRWGDCACEKKLEPG